MKYCTDVRHAAIRLALLLCAPGMSGGCRPVDDGLGDAPESRGLVAVGGGRRRQRLVAVGEVAAGHAGHPRVGRHVARGRRSLRMAGRVR